MKFLTQSDILVNLINYTQSVSSKITDFNIGSVARSIYDAISIEMENLYGLTMQNIEDGIVQGLMNSFDFYAKPAQPAFGNVVIEFNNELTANTVVPRGTTFTTNIKNDNNRYTTINDYIAPVGVTSIVVEAYANQAGVVGNVEARDINTIVTNTFNVSRVYNPEAFNTGVNEESYEETKRRFNLFIESRGRATKNAIRYGALEVPNVGSVYVYEQVGKVTVYVADKNGNLSDELKKDVQNNLEDYRPAAIELLVSPMKKLKVPVTVTLYPELGYKIDSSTVSGVSKTIRGYLNSLDADNNLIVSDLIKTIINYDDLVISDVVVTNPTRNIITSPSEIIRPDTVSVKAGEYQGNEVVVNGKEV